MAVVSLGLLVPAIGLGWLGPDVGRGNTFCEAAGTAWLKQPANSLSNIAFVVAGLLVAFHAGRRDGLGETLPRHPGVATAYACAVVLLGPGSAAMHATQSAAGGHLDVLSMYVFASFAAAYALMRLCSRDRLFLAQVFLLGVAGCELVGSWSGEVPVVMFAGNLAFAALLVTAVTLEVLLWRRGPARTDLRWGAGALGTLLVAFGIWHVTQDTWCDPHSLVQGHAVWHVLDAVAAYLLFRLWASERAWYERA